MPGEELRCATSQPPPSPIDLANDGGEAWVWVQIKAEARSDAEAEPALASYLYSTILSHSSLERSLSFHLGNKLCSSTLLSTLLYDLFLNTFSNDPNLRLAAVADLIAARYRDPACVSFSQCLLNYKGFLACQKRYKAHYNQGSQLLEAGIAIADAESKLRELRVEHEKMLKEFEALKVSQDEDLEKHQQAQLRITELEETNKKLEKGMEE